jgi:phosphoheptose isomerase
VSPVKFPNKKYNNIKNYKNDYHSYLIKGFNSINVNKLNQVTKILEKAYKNKKNKVFVCGNGGSAALANHFACDHQKILNETKKLKPFLISLSSNSALMTAISNDNKYECVFSDQINQIGKKSDILITISSSGSSKNIINAIKSAKKIGIQTISLTGFSGGLSKKISDINIHIESDNYGIIESLHHTIMNLISQFLKNKYFSLSKIKSRKF